MLTDKNLLKEVEFTTGRQLSDIILSSVRNHDKLRNIYRNEDYLTDVSLEYEQFKELETVGNIPFPFNGKDR